MPVIYNVDRYIFLYVCMPLYIYIYIDLFVLSSFKCILSLLMNSFSYCTFLHDLSFADVHVYVKWSLNFDLNFKIFL